MRIIKIIEGIGLEREFLKIKNDFEESRELAFAFFSW